jgi:hypothetical protein
MARFGLSTVIFANPAGGFRLRRDRILPLPEGEGRGEGERDVHTVCAAELRMGDFKNEVSVKTA